MDIGQKIKFLRRKAGLTQEQLGERLNLSAQSVSFKRKLTFTVKLGKDLLKAVIDHVGGIVDILNKIVGF